MTNKYNFKSGLLITALLAGVLLYPSFALAQSEKLQNALEDVNQSVEKIEEAEFVESEGSEEMTPETMTLSSEVIEESEAELATKKEALENVLSFSILEAEEIKGKLIQIKENSKDITTKNSAKQMLDLLDYRVGFLTDLSTYLEDEEVVLEDIKGVASNLKEWRETFYNPEIKMFLDAALVHQAELVIKKVEIRLGKIAQDVEKIEARVSGEPLTPLLQEAIQDFEKAEWYYLQARDQVFDLFDKRINVIEFVQLEPEEELGDTKLEAVIEEAVEEVKVIKEEMVTEAPEEVVVKEPETEEAQTKEGLESDTEEEIQALETNNQEIEKMSQAVQLYAEQVSDYIRQTYRSFLKMSTKAKAILSS